MAVFATVGGSRVMGVGAITFGPELNGVLIVKVLQGRVSFAQRTFTERYLMGKHTAHSLIMLSECSSCGLKGEMG